MRRVRRAGGRARERRRSRSGCQARRVDAAEPSRALRADRWTGRSGTITRSERLDLRLRVMSTSGCGRQGYVQRRRAVNTSERPARDGRSSAAVVGTGESADARRRAASLVSSTSANHVATLASFVGEPIGPAQVDDARRPDLQLHGAVGAGDHGEHRRAQARRQPAITSSGAVDAGTDVAPGRRPAPRPRRRPGSGRRAAAWPSTRPVGVDERPTGRRGRRPRPPARAR